MMTQVITDLKDNQRLSIDSIDPKKVHGIPPYFAMGRRGTSRHNIEGVDSAWILSTLSGRSSWFFWYLATCRTYETNLCNLRNSSMTTTEKGRVPRAYAELKKNYLVVRYTKGIYLINPKIILPDFKAYEVTWDKWVATCNKLGLPAEPKPVQAPQFSNLIHAIQNKNININISKGALFPKPL